MIHKSLVLSCLGWINMCGVVLCINLAAFVQNISGDYRGLETMPIDPKFLDLLEVASHDYVCLSCWLDMILEYLPESLCLNSKLYVFFVLLHDGRNTPK